MLLDVGIGKNSLIVMIEDICMPIEDATPKAIAHGIGEIALEHPDLFKIRFNELDSHSPIPATGESQEIDIKRWSDGLICSATGLSGFGRGETIPEAIGWLLCISKMFDSFPPQLEEALIKDFELDSIEPLLSR